MVPAEDRLGPDDLDLGGMGRRNIREIATDRTGLVLFVRASLGNILQGRLSGAMRVGVDPNAARLADRFAVGPDSLLSACYLEFVGMLVGRVAHMAYCDACGNAFVARRRDAKTCSDACRARLSYARRRVTAPARADE